MNDWLCEPFAWDDSRRLDRGKVHDRRGAGGRPRLRPLPRRRRRRHPLPHLSRHASDARAPFHPRHLARTATPATREEGAVYVDNMERLLRKFETAQGAGAARRSRARRRSADARRRDLLRLDRAGDGRGAGGAGGRRASTSTPCASAPSRSPTRSCDFIAAHDRVFVVEQNRDAQLRTLLINEGGVDPARLVAGAALRRHADHRPLHRRRHRRPRWRALKVDAAAGGRANDLPRQAASCTTRSCRRTRSASPAATTRARSRRCAPAAATTRSARRSSRPASSSTCRRTASPSCRASAARRRRRPISSAQQPRLQHACTAACPRC